MPLEVQVVSPERVLWSGEAERVVTRVEEGGDIAFLPGHTTYLGQLGQGVTEIAQVGGDVIKVAVHGGFVEVSQDRVSLLSDQAELATSIDVARARAAKQRAESALRGADDDDEALGAARRAEVRLRAAGHDTDA
ncbi:ATP synthase F1 subunit epsilon [Iamia sp. SCSIO 61187]|uniref:ATP synthase F1 subunit epsilon n=1 Tax=Iamia sp. SCSIO 61187 TaxID=2722752 RepID=UPI001C62FBE1|nr:ATP synthase F1 subunit epsilon [Iamia sp. SCSIO 61187]QYG94590.1 ATP synthase F1 subunit epsilon [Iamia sp. SCSIO 61187]